MVQEAGFRAPALLALGICEDDVHCALRFSLGHGTTGEDAERTLELLAEVFERSRSIGRFISCK